VKAVAVAVAASAALLAGLGCMGDNSLGGSMSEVFPLDVSFVGILRNQQAFQVNYYANNGNNVDLVAQVTLSLDGLNFQPGVDVPLQGLDADGGQRTTVLHLAAGSPPEPLPEVSLGDLQLNSGGDVGESTQGNFSMSFVADGGYGGGRTLYGNFSGQAQDAGYGDGTWPQ
jgi:hypothetical protein